MSVWGSIKKGTVGVVKSAAKGDLGGVLSNSFGGQMLGGAKNVMGYGATDYSGLDDPKDAAAKLRDALAAERGQPGYTPERVQASTVQAYDPGQAHLYDAVDPGAAREYAAALADAPRDVNVGPLKDVERVSATQLGEAAGGSFERVAGANLDTGKADQIRSKQDAYLSALESRANGNAPSVAENAYASKMADVSQNVLGIAGQARGSDKAYARLNAMNQIADQGRKAAFESAQLRAGEMAQASDALGGQLTNVRGQDVDTAKTAAQLAQEAALSNQRTGSTVSLANADSRNRRAEFGATQDLQAAGTNAAAGNARTMDEAQMRADVATGNVTRGQQNAQFNAAAQTGVAGDNAAAANARQDTRAAAQTAANAANAGAINARQDLRAGINNQTGQFNAGQTQGAAATNQAAGLAGNAQEIGRQQGLAGTSLGANAQVLDAAQAKIDGAEANQGKTREFAKGVIDVGAKVLTSDERVKKNVKDVPEDAAARLAKALDFKEFEYKGEHDDGREHVGVMAQDLERDPLGKKLVSEDDEGTKQVDYQGLTSLLLAAALRGKKEARR